MTTVDMEVVQKAHTEVGSDDTWRSLPVPPPPTLGSIQAAPPVQEQGASKVPVLFVLGGLLGLAASAVLPWVQVSSPLLSGTEYSLIEGAAGAKLGSAIFFSAVALFVGLSARRVSRATYVFVALVGLAASATAYRMMVGFGNEFSGQGILNVSVSWGPGVPLAFLSGLVCIGAAVVGVVEATRNKRV